MPPSRLSSLLVRDGLVGVRRMETAFQRQVIYGGCLDTILLEMSVLPEARLLQYLSLATGLPPATREETNVFDAQAVTKCPVDLAKQFRIVPLCFEEGALRVLVHDPVELSLLEDLANELEFPVQPLVAPEYRFHVVFARTFGGTPDERFQALAQRAEDDTVSAPVGKAKTIIVEDSARPAPVVPTSGDDSEHVVVDVALPPSGTRTEDSVTRSQELAELEHQEAEAQERAEAEERERAEAEERERAEAEERERAEAEERERAEAEERERAEAEERERAEAEERERAEAEERERAEAEERARAEADARERAQAEEERREIETAHTQRIPSADQVAATRGRSAPKATMMGIGVVGTGQLPYAPVSHEQGPAHLGPIKLSALIVDDDDEEELEPTLPAIRVPKVDPAHKAIEPAPVIDDHVDDHDDIANAAAAAEPVAAPDGIDSRAASQPSEIAHAVETVAPMDAESALVALEQAEERDEIFNLLLRAIRHRAQYAGLLTIQGGAAIGRVAIIGNELDRGHISEVLIPLDSPSAFKTVVESAAPHIGPIATGDPEIDSMIERLGGILPPSALLLPIALRKRVVALAVGHEGERAIEVDAMAALRPLSIAAADAISRLIVRAKARKAGKPVPVAAMRSAPVSAPVPALVVDSRSAPASIPDETPAAPAPEELVAAETSGPAPAAVSAQSSEPVSRPASDERSAPVRKPTADPLEPLPEAATAAPMSDSVLTPAPDLASQVDAAEAAAPAESPRPPSQPRQPKQVDELLDELESGEKSAAAAAQTDLLTRKSEAISGISRRFPGKLAVDRYDLGGRLLSAPQHGKLLALIVEIGDDAHVMLAAKMAADERDIRYYATLCMGELRSKEAEDALIDRLFDSDYGVRSAAIAGLGGFPLKLLNRGLSRLRKELKGDDPQRVQASANALAQLSDINSMTALVEVVGRGRKFAEYGRRALVRLSKQDFGTSARKWRNWLNKNLGESRIKWLLDGLAHKDDAIRRSSVEELRSLTGEFFDFQYDVGKRDREPARKRWLKWWEDEGMERFKQED